MDDENSLMIRQEARELVEESKKWIVDTVEKILSEFQARVDARFITMQDRLDAIEKLVADRSRSFKPPTVEEVTAYAKEIKFDSLNAQQFVDYYSARNWFIGKTKMKNWKAAIRTWKSRRDQELKERHWNSSDTLPRK